MSTKSRSLRFAVSLAVASSGLALLAAGSAMAQKMVKQRVEAGNGLTPAAIEAARAEAARGAPEKPAPSEPAPVAGTNAADAVPSPLPAATAAAPTAETAPSPSAQAAAPIPAVAAPSAAPSAPAGASASAPAAAAPSSVPAPSVQAAAPGPAPASQPSLEGKPAEPAAPSAAAPAIAPASASAAAPPVAASAAKAAAAGAAKAADGKADRAAAASAALAASRAAAEKRDRADDDGVDDDRDIVKPVLARHPDSNLVICIAGCGPEPQIVQVLPKEPETRTDSQVVPSSANADAADSKPSSGEIRCVAGCNGKRGEVVFKRGRLSWIDPNESDRVRHALREIAARLSTELKVIAAAEQSQTLTSWAGMGRQALDAVAPSPTLADASADLPSR